MEKDSEDVGKHLLVGMVEHVPGQYIFYGLLRLCCTLLAFSAGTAVNCSGGLELFKFN
jgi:hypothetical protein